MTANPVVHHPDSALATGAACTERSFTRAVGPSHRPRGALHERHARPGELALVPPEQLDLVAEDLSCDVSGHSRVRAGRKKASGRRSLYYAVRGAKLASGAGNSAAS